MLPHIEWRDVEDIELIDVAGKIFSEVNSREVFKSLSDFKYRLELDIDSLQNQKKEAMQSLEVVKSGIERSKADAEDIIKNATEEADRIKKNADEVLSRNQLDSEILRKKEEDLSKLEVRIKKESVKAGK